MTILADKNDTELISLYGEVMAALHERGIVRSANTPIADIAERLIADYYGVDRLAPNNKSFDVVAPDGSKIEVKALRRTKRNAPASRRYGPSTLTT